MKQITEGQRYKLQAYLQAGIDNSICKCIEILLHSSRPNERYSNGVSPVCFLKNEKKYSVD